MSPHKGTFGLGSDDNRCVVCGKHIVEGTEILVANSYKAHPNCQRDKPEIVEALLKWLAESR